MGKKVLKDWKSDWVVLGSPSETRRKEARGGKGRGGGGQLLMGLWEDAWRSIPLIVSGHLFSLRIRQISLSV